MVKIFYLVALENHFLKNSYPLNIFMKIFLCRKIFIIGKSFCKEQLSTTNFDETFFGPKFFIGKHNYLMIVFENDHSKYDFPHYLKKEIVENFL